jgi:DNA-binding response OmpR family regulator
MSTLHVLLVDDDPKFRSFACSGLQESGFECTAAANAQEALAALEARGDDAGSFDAILLDIMMPGMSGWDLLERIRDLQPDAPIIFVTARESVDERVRGLRMGADDYIIKPFAFSELLARIGAVVRRRQSAVLRVFGLRLDLLERRASVDDTPIELSPKEFDLLRVLVDRKDEVLSRRALLQEVWHTDRDPGTNVVEVHVTRLRRKLASAGGPMIRNIRGSGYALMDPGTERAD